MTAVRNREFNPTPPTDIQKWLSEAPEGKSRHHELEFYNYREPRWHATYAENTWIEDDIDASARGWAAGETPDEARQAAWDAFVARAHLVNTKPYVVGNGLYCDEVARFASFDEALRFYRTIPRPRPGEMRAVGIWNKDEADGATDGNHDGLTDEEREQL